MKKVLIIIAILLLSLNICQLDLFNNITNEDKPVVDDVNNGQIENDIKEEVNDEIEIEQPDLEEETEPKEEKPKENDSKQEPENFDTKNESVKEPEKPTDEKEDIESDLKEDVIVETPNEEVEEPKEEIKPELTQEEKNLQYKKQIEDKYGLKIVYGEFNYSPGGTNPIKMTDATKISEYLQRLDKSLSYYPGGFFKEIINYGMPATIYLIERTPNGEFAGLADYQFYNDVKITISSGLLFERTLNHELFHYIDAYLDNKMYPDNVSITWNKLNPEDFIYGSVMSQYTYNGTNSQEAYFVTEYCQTNYREDRATLFADMMTRAYTKDYYNDSTPINLKAKQIALELDTHFTSVISTTQPYWFRFIK